MQIEFYHSFIVPEKGINLVGQWDLNKSIPHLEKIDVAGKSVLDVACRDGWYGFHFEKKGAREVNMLDMDDRAARRFMKKVFNSKAQFIHKNAYTIHSFLMEGEYDVTFAGDVICHLFDPIRFLRNVHHVTREYFYLVADVWPNFEMWYEGYPWKMTLAEIMKMLTFAGFLEPTVLSSYQLEGAYWQSKGLQYQRDVKLIRCKRNPDWHYDYAEGIIPRDKSVNGIPELTYHIDFKE